MNIQVHHVEVGELFRMPEDVIPTSELTPRQTLAGRPSVVVFFVDVKSDRAAAELGGFRDTYGEFVQLGATVVGAAAVGLDELKAFAQEHRLPFPLLCDRQLKLSLALGSARPERVEAGKADISIGSRTVLLDANHRV